MTFPDWMEVGFVGSGLISPDGCPSHSSIIFSCHPLRHLSKMLLAWDIGEVWELRGQSQNWQCSTELEVA